MLRTTNTDSTRRKVIKAIGAISGSTYFASSAANAKNNSTIVVEIGIEHIFPNIDGLAKYSLASPDRYMPYNTQDNTIVVNEKSHYEKINQNSCIAVTKADYKNPFRSTAGDVLTPYRQTSSIPVNTSNDFRPVKSARIKNTISYPSIRIRPESEAEVILSQQGNKIQLSPQEVGSLQLNSKQVLLKTKSDKGIDYERVVTTPIIKARNRGYLEPHRI
jgi:hypothetical protein